MPLQRFETTFNIYTPEGQIGEGGSGWVWRVRDAQGELFALKCLRPDAVNTTRRKRFQNEIQFCQRQDHVNIVKILDSGVTLLSDQSVPFYVMPFYPNTLRDLLRGGIEPCRALHLFGQALNGVEAAHFQGVHHRDLKPENILYDPASDRLVVADFGIAHFAEEALYTAVETRANERLANFLYAAPEQRARGQGVDHRADIYALGLILNEMFTGHVPQGSGYVLVASTLRDHSYLDGLIDFMIRQSPSERPGSIQIIKEQLIGRQKEFISLQKLDALRGQVVPAATPDDPLAGKSVQITEVDYDGANLVFTLTPRPPSQWISSFSSLGEFQSFHERGPRTVQFVSHRALIGARENEVEQMVRFVRTWVESTNKEYRDTLMREAHQREQADRRRLADQIQREEQRQRILEMAKAGLQS